MLAPTLVMAGDHDLIRLSHTMQIFEALPNAQLAILPGATHAAPYDDSAAFNAVVERFLKSPFRKTDRIADFMVSDEKLLAESVHWVRTSDTAVAGGRIFDESWREGPITPVLLP